MIVINHQPWTANAKCNGEDPETYETSNLPNGPARTKTAARLCQGCPVLTQCGTYALQNPDTTGVIMAGIAYPDDMSHTFIINKARKAVANAIGTHLIEQRTRHTPTGEPNIATLNRNKTHCHKGHEFTPENTYMSTNSRGTQGRRCKTCQRHSNRISKQNNRARSRQNERQDIPA